LTSRGGVPSRTTRTRGRSVSVFAKQLGGTAVVNAIVYPTSTGDLLKPCEMPAATLVQQVGAEIRCGPAPGDVHNFQSTVQGGVSSPKEREMGCARGGTTEAGDVEETPDSAHADAVHPVNRVVERRDIRRRLGVSAG